MKRLDRFTKSECIDTVEVANRDKIYPLIFCHIKFENKIKIELLKNAVERSTLYVPEILYTYDYFHGRFIDKGLTVSDAIIENQKFTQNFDWHLEKDTQLKILLNEENNKTDMVIGISHILCDGNGFLQYLYLLAALYSKKELPKNLENNRKLSPYLKGIKVKKSTEQTKDIDKQVQVALDAGSRGNTPFCLYETIDEADFRCLKEKASLYNVTLNDVFLTAYACVIAKLKNIENLYIPCPANLRKFQPNNNALTIANLTGMYRKIPIEVKSDYTFTDILKRVHLEMLLQKSKCLCFAGISKFNAIFSKMPFCILTLICRMFYHIMPISYTNIGIIDDKKLCFSECRIENCFLTGSYRDAPDFQLAISTYKNKCTLSCNVFGDQQRKVKCQEILKLIKHEIQIWINI